MKRYGKGSDVKKVFSFGLRPIVAQILDTLVRRDIKLNNGEYDNRSRMIEKIIIDEGVRQEIVKKEHEW